MTFDPARRLADLQSWPWDFPGGVAPAPETYFKGQFSERNVLNVPGPFYGAATDTCCCGPGDAPASVLYDAKGMEFFWRQPRTDAETHALMAATFSDPFHGYGSDGDARWTPELVRTWWRDLDSRREAINAVIFQPPVMGSGRANADVATLLADWFDYVKGSDMPTDLRRYLYRLEVGCYPTGKDILPLL